MNREAELLLRYLDDDLSPLERRDFCVRLASSAGLRRQLRDLQRVGEMVRIWSRNAEERAADLVAPTLERVREQLSKAAEPRQAGEA